MDPDSNSHSTQRAGDPATGGDPLGGEQDRFAAGRDLTRWRTPPGRWLARWTHRLSARLGPHAALVIPLCVGAVLALLLTIGSAGIYDAVTENDGVATLDHPLLNAAEGLRSPTLNTLVTGYTNIGGPIAMPLLAVGFMMILAVRRRSWTPVVLIVAAAAGSLLMTIVGKHFIGRTRPPLIDAVPPYEYSASFPSGHSLNALVIAGIIAYLLLLRQHSHRAGVLIVVVAAVFAFSMGLSRVYLGHHWFTDVLVAWTLGAAWLALVITAHRLYLTAQHRTRARTRNSQTVTDHPDPGPAA
ncbi:phosphatase PAP2 family protein [Arthrobacter burdickii]|uniref:Phosphatase PAP2 family protein n=1 Tax=Arthrobacter burdickii TaxID=3035920 RepID=A0ABT8JWK8_9MICC|nr:phosphatase PAP2 family protein [Arthrobacter burdickii]MDN4609561.1 phosphatase PAP2 family protein [Arthrobacter burdickii]